METQTRLPKVGDLYVTRRKLPKIQDLYENKELALKRNTLEVLLNHEPKKDWIKKHPIYKNDYIPIEIVEWLLTSIYGRWWVEIREVKQLLNSAVVHIRLWVEDPLTGNDIFQDGVGAHNFQLEKGAASDDFSKMSQGAVMLAVPIAESRAISDAADKFGKIFGKDLNRKHQTNYVINHHNEFNRDHPNWEKMLQAVKGGKYTAQQVIAANNIVDDELIKEIYSYDK